MFEVTITQECADELKKLPRPIRQKAKKQISILANNPFHPSLHTEKLMPKQREHWSIRIDLRHRIVFRFLDRQQLILLTAGNHDFVYRYQF